MDVDPNPTPVLADEIIIDLNEAILEEGSEILSSEPDA
jgi:hypothetical protein